MTERWEHWYPGKEETFKRNYAMIRRTVYGLISNGQVSDASIGLQLDLSLDDGGGAGYVLENPADIRGLLTAVKARDISGLEGKVIEVFSKVVNTKVMGIGVNPNLV